MSLPIASPLAPFIRLHPADDVVIARTQLELQRIAAGVE